MTRIQEEIEQVENFIVEKAKELAYETAIELIYKSGFDLDHDKDDWFDLDVIDGDSYIVVTVEGTGNLEGHNWWIEFNVRQDDFTYDNSLKIIIEEFASGEGKYNEDEDEDEDE